MTGPGTASMREGEEAPSRRPYGVWYQPDDGWVGDVIPFYHDGAFYLYYLHDWRAPGSGRGTAWRLVRTRDLREWEELGEVIPAGGPEAQDFNAYTGSVIEAEDGFHLFYTGHNPNIVDEATGEPLQAVMHATSADLIEWTKLPGHTFHAPRERYERGDWRDPFVYRDPHDGSYAMLLAARELEGLNRRRGCIALCTSDDLSSWELQEPAWSPGLYITHECPELFRMGDTWYLTFSEFSERFTARYRMSRDSIGPWLLPQEDTLDGRAFYAPRTASDGQHRYAFGWTASKAGETDDGAWEWAGTMTAHELSQRTDGSLAVSLPGPVRDSFATPLDVSPAGVAGRWSIDPMGVTAFAEGTFALADAGPMDDPCLISANVSFSRTTRACGIALRMGQDPDEAYYIRLEPQRSRLVFDRWPRRATGHMQWQQGGDVPHAVELERVVRLEPDVTHRLEIVVDGSTCVAYLDGSVAMSARMYDRPQGHWGLFATEGTVSFTDLSIRVRRPHS